MVISTWRRRRVGFVQRSFAAAGCAACAAPQSSTRVVIGLPNWSGPMSTFRTVNRCSSPLGPPRRLRSASLVFVTSPLTDLSPSMAITTSALPSLALVPRVPVSTVLPKWSIPITKHPMRSATAWSGIHDRLAGGGVVILAVPGVAGGSDNGVDDDQHQRHTEPFLE